MKKDMLKSIVVLSVICLVIAVLLAAVNYITAPIIEEAAVKAQQEALTKVLPDATAFESVALTGEVPGTVTEIYRDAGGSGYAFVVKAEGYGGASNPITLIVGIDSTGEITRCSVTDVSGESAGIGDKVAEKGFLATFEGKDSALEGVSTISGATISSTGFLEGIRDAFTAFYAVSDVEQTDEQKIAELIYTALPGSLEKAGFTAVTATGTGVASVMQAKNGVGYSVVLSDGTLTLVVGINSFGRVCGAYDLTKTDRANDTDTAVTALLATAKNAVAGMIQADAAVNETKLANLLASGAVLTGIGDVTGLPGTVIAAYSVSGDTAAYAFVLQTYGYKSIIRIAVTVSADGAIVKTKTLSQAESDDYGAKVGNSSYTDRYEGITSSTVSGDALLISGATKTTTAYRAAVADMFMAYSLVKEAGK